MPGSRTLVLVLTCTLIGVHCSASGFLQKRYADYNFRTEGFLTPGLLQTIGEAQLPLENTGTRNGRRLCFREAEEEARTRAIRVLLHTHFDIPAVETRRVFGAGRGDFERDYPYSFTERDRIRAQVDFASLLSRGFIALQDSRSRNACMVVFRIQGEDLPEEIRAVQVSFRPERAPWEKRRDNQQESRSSGRLFPVEFSDPFNPDDEEEEFDRLFRGSAQPAP